MSFVCGICQGSRPMNQLAFTYDYDDEGKKVTEGICGDCADDN